MTRCQPVPLGGAGACGLCSRPVLPQVLRLVLWLGLSCEPGWLRPRSPSPLGGARPPASGSEARAAQVLPLKRIPAQRLGDCPFAGPKPQGELLHACPG